MKTLNLSQVFFLIMKYPELVRIWRYEKISSHCPLPGLVRVTALASPQATLERAASYV
jgi:hypothetical protein